MQHNNYLKFALVNILVLSIVVRIESRGNLIWQDEFVGNLQTNWNIVDAGDSFGNNGLQYYKAANARIVNGNLIIDSKKENYANRQYTSARLISRRTFKYGYFEMRAKLPRGRGNWPAFLLQSATNPLDWPRDGEIDIMENVGFEANTIHSTIHFENNNHVLGNAKSQSVNVNDLYNTYHTYAADWNAQSITFYVDNVKYFQYNRPDNTVGNYPFDHDFYIVINNELGGTWGGQQGIDDSLLPSKFIIDYVRVYDTDGSKSYNFGSSRKVTIRAKVNSNFVTADDGGKKALIASREKYAGWETFELYENLDGTISFKALANSKFVTADNNGKDPLIANRDSVDTWEKFDKISNPDGTYSFKAKVNGKFVTADNAGEKPLIADRDTAQEWESFIINYL